MRYATGSTHWRRGKTRSSLTTELSPAHLPFPIPYHVAMAIRDKLRGISRRKGVPYLLSIPERTVRSATALTAGVVREVADVVLPIGVRRGRLYRNMVNVTLRFLIENVGQVKGVYPEEEKLTEDFLLRRTAGNGIEMLGILAFWASPVWVLAALADVCGLGRQMIPEIAESLKSEGLLDRDANFTTMDQLLEGLEGSAGHLAETINTPPLDIAGLRREWTQFVTEVRKLPSPNLPSASVLTRLWSDVREEAKRQ